MRLVFCDGLRYQVHMPNDSIDKLAHMLAEVVPQGLKSVRDDLEQNFQSIFACRPGKTGPGQS